MCCIDLPADQPPHLFIMKSSVRQISFRPSSTLWLQMVKSAWRGKGKEEELKSLYWKQHVLKIFNCYGAIHYCTKLYHCPLKGLERLHDQMIIQKGQKKPPQIHERVIKSVLTNVCHPLTSQLFISLCSDSDQFSSFLCLFWSVRLDITSQQSHHCGEWKSLCWLWIKKLLFLGTFQV